MRLCPRLLRFFGRKKENLWEIFSMRLRRIPLRLGRTQGWPTWIHHQSQRRLESKTFNSNPPSEPIQLCSVTLGVFPVSMAIGGFTFPPKATPTGIPFYPFSIISQILGTSLGPKETTRLGSVTTSTFPRKTHTRSEIMQELPTLSKQPNKRWVIAFMLRIDPSTDDERGTTTTTPITTTVTYRNCHSPSSGLKFGINDS